MTLFLVFLESPSRVLVFRNPPNPGGQRELPHCTTQGGAIHSTGHAKDTPGVVHNLSGFMCCPPQEAGVENLSPSLLRGRTLLGLFFSY